MFESLFNRYPFFRYIPVILGMALIFRSSATTGSELGFLIPPWDKVFHALVYMCLGAAFALCFKLSVWKEKPYRTYIISFLLSVLYGASDEFHQTFVPGRDGGVPDLLADASGAFVGVLLYFLLIKFLVLKKNNHSIEKNQDSV